MRHSRLILFSALIALFVLVACGGAQAASSHSGAAGPRTRTASPATTAVSHTPKTASDALSGWSQYHRGPARSGHLTTAPTDPLHKKWAANLDGAVYGEPLVVGSTLIVATEEDDVYGLNALTGKQLWETNLGTPAPLSSLPCGDIDPLGITGTPAYDSATGSVFVAAETTGGTHTLWALDATTGAKRWSRNLDTQTNRSKLAEQERGAVLVTDNRVLVDFGGLAGDCSNYVGYVVSTPTSGSGSSYSYAVPTSREAGMWATPGPVAGFHGDVYVAAGNGADLTGTWEKSDSVTELTPVKMQRESVFAPQTWQQDNQDDLDLGSSSPAIVTAQNRVVIAGKRGTVYLLKPTMGGVGSAVTNLTGCKAFGGAAIDGSTVLMPCKGEQEIRELHVTSSKLSWGWSHTSLYGSPVIAGQSVYVTDQSTGDLVVLGLAHGHTIARYHVGAMPHFPSEVVSGNWVFVPSLSGVTAFQGS